MTIHLFFLLTKIGINQLSIYYNNIIYIQVYAKKITLIKIENKNIFIFWRTECVESNTTNKCLPDYKSGKTTWLLYLNTKYKTVKLHIFCVLK